MPSRYQNMIQVSFCDTKSYQAIPIASETISVTLPLKVHDRPGGIGLDDLEPILESQGYVKDADIPAFGNIMDSVIEKGEKENVEDQNIVEVKVLRSGMCGFCRALYSY